MTEGHSNAFTQYAFLLNAAEDSVTIKQVREQIARDEVLRSRPNEMHDICVIALARIEYLDMLINNKIFALQFSGMRARPEGR